MHLAYYKRFSRPENMNIQFDRWCYCCWCVFVNNITHNFAKIIDTCTHSCPKTIEFEWEGGEGGVAVQRCTKISIDCGTLCLSHWHIHQPPNTHTYTKFHLRRFLYVVSHQHTNCTTFVRFFSRLRLLFVLSAFYAGRKKWLVFDTQKHMHTFLEYPFQSFGFLWVSFTHYLNATFLILMLSFSFFLLECDICPCNCALHFLH